MEGSLHRLHILVEPVHHQPFGFVIAIPDDLEPEALVQAQCGVQLLDAQEIMLVLLHSANLYRAVFCQ